MVNSVPYTESFDTQNAFSSFMVVDANADGTTWFYNSDSKFARYNWNDNNDADDWLLTPYIYLEGGKHYFFSFTYERGYRSGEKLAVAFGMGDDPSAYEVVDEGFEIESWDITEYKEEVSVATSGNYRFGFHAISPKKLFYINIDDISVTESAAVVAPDVATGLAAVVYPGKNNHLEIVVSKSQKEEVVFEDIDFSTMTGEEGWRKVLIPLASLQNEKYIVLKFHAVVNDVAYPVVFDALEIKNIYDSDLSAHLNVEAETQVGRQTPVVVTVENVGSSAVDDYTVDLPEGAAYFAIRCISKDKFIFMVDDITYHPKPLSLIGFNVYRDGVKIGSTAAETTSYTYDELNGETHVYAVSAVYDEGESPLSNCVSARVATMVYGRVVRLV